jgi:hypothetical protein
MYHIYRRFNKTWVFMQEYEEYRDVLTYYLEHQLQDLKWEIV